MDSNYRVSTVFARLFFRLNLIVQYFNSFNLIDILTITLVPQWCICRCYLSINLAHIHITIFPYWFLFRRKTPRSCSTTLWIAAIVVVAESIGGIKCFYSSEELVFVRVLRLPVLTGSETFCVGHFTSVISAIGGFTLETFIWKTWNILQLS